MNDIVRFCEPILCNILGALNLLVIYRLKFSSLPDINLLLERRFGLLYLVKIKNNILTD